MLRSALRSLLAHRVRLVLTVLSVLLGVSFVAGTFVFTDSLRRSLDGLFARQQADVVVTARDDVGRVGPRTLPASTVAAMAALPGAARAAGYVGVNGAVVLGADGRPVSGDSPQASGQTWLDDPRLSGLTLVRGRAPAADGEVALEASTAQRAGADVGGTVRLSTPHATDAARAWTVVGVVEQGVSASFGGGTAVVFDLATGKRVLLGADAVTRVLVLARPGVAQDALAAQALDALPSARVRTGQEVVDETARRLQEALAFLTTFLLVFALIALFVAGFLIANTFSMLVAQRVRELALLRAVGATRAQVQASVLAEAAAVGLVASTLGLGAGLGLAQLLRALFRAFGADLPGGPLVVAPRTVAATYAVGMAVTLVAAWLPARRASRVPPVAALRDQAAPGPAGMRLRAAGGVLLAAAAAALAVASLRTPGDAERAASVAGASALAGLLAAVVLAPFLARPVLAGLGRLVPTAVGRLARENGRRNPRRTAATASALTVGLALMSTLAVVAASATASTDAVIDDSIGADFVVLDLAFRPMPDSVARSLAGAPGTAVVTAVRQTAARTADGSRATVTGVDPAAFPRVVDLTLTAGSWAALGDGRALLDTRTAAANGYRAGQRVRVAAPDGPAVLELVGLYEPAGLYSGFVVTRATAEALSAPAQDQAVYVRLAPGADPAAVRADLDRRLAAYPVVQVQDQRQFKDAIRDRVGQVLGFLLALLALGVVIAFLGIVNTLLLSVVERTREIGLLRAVGATRAQVRRMVVVEAGLLGTFGALQGVALGIVYGVLLQRVLADQGVRELAVPAGQLAAFVALGTVGGMVAALWPALRASRLDVLRAVGAE